MQEIIAHIKCPYLPVTQTFIYELLTHLESQVTPLYTNQHINPQLFPYERLYLFKNFNELARLWSDGGIKAIHAHFGHNGIYILPLKKSLGLPMLTSFHGADVSSRPRENPAYLADLRELFVYGDLFTVVSKAMQKRVAALGCPEDKIRVLRCGIDPEKIPFRTVKPEAGKLTILSVGRLVEKKGMTWLLRAMTLVKAEDPEGFRLLIAGDGPLRNELEKLRDELGLHNDVNFLGTVTHQEIIELLRKAHVFILASCQGQNGDCEGVPVSLMEAMAAGLPVISTFHEGIPELVIDGVSGLLVREKDYAALARAILSFKENLKLWPKMTRAARLRVEKEYNVNGQVAVLQAIYRELLKQ